jgi:hypothetical protein
MRNAYCAGPEDDLQLPKESAQVDWEVELGVVIGKGGRYAVPLLYVLRFLIRNLSSCDSKHCSVTTPLRQLYVLRIQNHSRCDCCCTDKKEKKIFFIFKEIQIGSVAKTYMRNGFLMRKYATI